VYFCEKCGRVKDRRLGELKSCCGKLMELVETEFKRKVEKE